MEAWIWVLAAAYLCGRTLGKMLGRGVSAPGVSGASEMVRRHLGLCLFSQAGVAIGLSILLASQHFTGDMAHIGQTVVIVVTASTFVVQLIGPPCVKIGRDQSGAKVGINITTEDLVASYTVSDVMEKSPIAISDDAPLGAILTTFSQHDFLCYPVVDESRHVVGAISFQQIKETLMTGDLHHLLLAVDLMEEVSDFATPDAPLQDTLDRMKQMNADTLPVIASDTDRETARVPRSWAREPAHQRRDHPARAEGQRPGRNGLSSPAIRQKGPGRLAPASSSFGVPRRCDTRFHAPTFRT